MASRLSLCLVDMNNGVPNEATRCFTRIFEAFQAKVLQANPGLEISFEHVQPRNLGQLPSRHVDLVLSSGGPGAPTDGYEEPWCTGYRKFLDGVIDRNLGQNQSGRADAPGLFAVCHSFEIAVTHFGFARLVPRSTLKFGVFPAYVTEEGASSVLFEPFDDRRLFTWEHRNFETVDLDVSALQRLGGKLLATESRPGGTDKGQGLMAFDFGPGIIGTQFHPEADRPGVIAWINRPEHAMALKDAYGNSLYERMMQTLKDPSRLARTYALAIPSWLRMRFNRLAEVRGLKPIGAPAQDMRMFEAD